MTTLASPWLPLPAETDAADVVDAVLGHVAGQADDMVTMADAAARVGMSQSAFSRYFRRAAGQNFSHTVRKLRLAQACQQLEHTDDPVATICHRSGYRNLSNFNRQFLREYGTTPGEHRREYRRREAEVAG